MSKHGWVGEEEKASLGPPGGAKKKISKVLERTTLMNYD